MAEKNLPIKFFEKRIKDEQRNEGFGNGKLPKFVMPQKELAAHSIYVKQFLGYVGSSLRTKIKRDNYLPTVFRVKIIEKATAKGHRNEIGKLFNISEKINVIGILGNDELLVKVDNIQDLEIIEKNAANCNKNAIGLSAISELDSFEPLIFLKGENQIAKVKLFNYQDYELNKVLISSFEKYCNENKIKCEKLEYTPDLQIYQVVMDNAFDIDDFKGFEGIYSIVDMPIVEASTEQTEEETEIEIKVPVNGIEYPTVGVLDSGVSDNKYIQPWKVGSAEKNILDEYVDKSHGTLVAGIIVRGDDLEERELTGTDGCNIFEAIVIDDQKGVPTTEWELTNNIKMAIKENKEIKIWNLSLGTGVEADFDEFSDFAKTLDKLQDDYNVLIIKSAGNCKKFQTGGPKSRIAKSADSIRSLVVGSIAHSKNDTDISDINHPSPFTRIGPGPAKTIKPDIVHYGGNAGMKGGVLIKNGVKSIGIDGKITSIIGTSFSTPRVTAVAAGLINKLKEEFNPLLIKALILHNAKFPNEITWPIAEKIKQIGFGLPTKINEIIYNDEHEITLILHDTLERGSFINILDFPFPQSMTENGFYYGDVTVTLVNSPLLGDGNGSEYCQSDIEVSFGTYENKKERDINKRGIKNPIGTDGARNILHQSCYSLTKMKEAENPFNSERIIINYGEKWTPNKKYVVRLEEMTESNMINHLAAPKLWYLKIENQFRNSIEEKGRIQGFDPSNEFCLIITIKDNKKQHRIYDEVSNYLNEYNFIHNNIKIKEHIRIEHRN